MRIYITRDDIKNGRQCNAGKCPVARSLQRRFPKEFISVGPLGAAIGNTHVLWTARVKRFIQTFDYTPTEAKPFSFTLDL